jgi:TonB-linked SusC/RagA family outer membrane protein
MRKIVSMLFLLLVVLVLHAQQRTVTGTVRDEKGDPVAFATVTEAGTRNAVQADANGNFSISISANGRLAVSASGYAAQTIAVSGSTASVSLVRGEGQLQEVVVTALGISRAKQAVGYATQSVSAEKLNQTKVADINTALAGKVSGIQIRSGSGAKFGNSTIRLRGVNNLTGGNPIYVVDGVITSSEAINPEDVETLSVLKGPAATALYGQRGSEGAIVITSKKGRRSGVGIDVSHTTTFERVYILPEYQNEYGGGYSQSFNTFTFDPATMPANLAGLNGAKYLDYFADESWGPRLDGTLYAPYYAWDPTDPEFGKLKPFVAQPNNIRDFYETGITNNTTVAFSKGAAESNLRISFTNLTRNGVSPNTKQQKNWISLNGTNNLTRALSIVSNINYVYENRFNVPLEGFSNQTSGSFNQWFQRNIETDKLKRYKRADGSFTSWNTNGPLDPSPKYWDNPYTEAYENTANSDIQRAYGNLTLAYKMPMGLRFSANARANYFNRNSTSRVASFTLHTPSYGSGTAKSTEVTYIGSAEYDKNFSNLSLRAGVFGELRTNTRDDVSTSTRGGFIQPNVYNVSNSLNEKNATNYYEKRKVNSLYGYINLGYNDLVFLELSARNDVSSTLPTENNSYIYGSASGSFVFSKLIRDNNLLSFGKLRASIAQVGTDVDAFNIFETYPLGTNYVVGSTTYSLQGIPNTMLNPDLKPALSTSYEIGTEMQFLKNRARLDVNYFWRSAKDQILPVSIPGTTGYTSKYINAGDIRNNGFEITVGGAPIRRSDLNWDIDFNLGIFNNKVEELAPGVDNIQTGLDGSNISFGFVGAPRISLNARVGQPFGQIIGRGIKKDANGNNLINDEGFYVTEEDQLLGSSLPDFTGGVSSGLRYKNFNLGFSLDFQKGGKFASVTKMLLAGSGLGIETVGNNDKGNPIRNPVADGGGVKLIGVNETTGKVNEIYVEAKDLYQGQLNSLWGNWVYDASYIKLREVSLGYNLPKTLFSRLPFQSANVSLIGQNLWLIYSKTKGIDPSELEQSWMEGGQLPGTRSMGVKLNLIF